MVTLLVGELVMNSAASQAEGGQFEDQLAGVSHLELVLLVQTLLATARVNALDALGMPFTKTVASAGPA